MEVEARSKLHALLANVESRILEKAHNPYLAPELRLTTPAKWLLKYISGSHELHELLEFISLTDECNYLLRYIVTSKDPFVLWEIEKEFKSTNEWGPFIFSMIASCFAATLQGDMKWESWAQDHQVAWMDVYKPF